jgi:hypothetical protein
MSSTNTTTTNNNNNNQNKISIQDLVFMVVVFRYIGILQ